MAALEGGGVEGVLFDDVDVRAPVRVAAKDKDRYLVVTGGNGGGGREEWRSGGWIRQMLERGHWRVVQTPSGPAAGTPAPAAGPAPSGGMTLIRRTLRGGHVELALPEDVTPDEARAAVAEIERLAALVRAFC